MVLHTVNKAPLIGALTACLDIAQTSDSLLLLEDGVLAALDNPANRALLAGRDALPRLYVLRDDLQARGLLKSALLAGIEDVDYAGFVALCTRHTRVQHWF